MHGKGWRTGIGAIVAVAALAAAFYFFTLAFLYESGCHLGDATACMNEARALRLSLVLAIAFVIIGGITLATALRRVERRPDAEIGG